MKKVLLLAALFWLSVDISFAQIKEVRKYVREGNRQLKNGEATLALSKFQKADELMPEHPIILRLLAVASTESGNTDLAFEYLDRLSYVFASEELLDYDAFDPIRESKEFSEIRLQFKAANKTISNSDTAFTMEDKLLHPEGIAYQEGSNSFFISSIHQGKVLKVDADGNQTEIFTNKKGGVSGLKIDDQNGWLWVTSGNIKQWLGYKEAKKGESFVLKVDLNTGDVLDEFTSIDEEKRYFGDLEIQPGSDRVYVTDSESPALFMIDPDNERMNLVDEFENLVSLQGLAFNETGDQLFFSDYRYGIFKYGIQTGDLTKIKAKPGFSLNGVDGLYYHEGSLLAIHNGIQPFRVIQYFLNGDMTEVESVRVIEQANPALNEPTLGVLVGDLFYYVANSSWPRYDQEGKIAPEELHPRPLIMKFNLRKR